MSHELLPDDLEPLRAEVASLQAELVSLIGDRVRAKPAIGIPVAEWMWRSGRFEIREIGEVLDAANVPDGYWDDEIALVGMRLREEHRRLGWIIPSTPDPSWVQA